MSTNTMTDHLGNEWIIKSVADREIAELKANLAALACENAKLKKIPASNSERMLLALDAFKTHGNTRPDTGLHQALTVLMSVETPATDAAISSLARELSLVEFSESDDADHCRLWAWKKVMELLTTDGWKVGDKENFYGFYCWGWDMRRQFDEQRKNETNSQCAKGNV